MGIDAETDGIQQTTERRPRKLKRIVYITPYHPSAVGLGGHHRAYQLKHDIELLPQVKVETVLWTAPSPPGAKSLRDFIRLRSRLAALKNSWRNFLGRCYLSLLRKIPSRSSRIVVSELSTPEAPYLSLFPLTDSFLNYLRGLFLQSKPDLVVLDFPGWARIASLCREMEIKTLFCPQNLESLLLSELLSSPVDNILDFKLKKLGAELKLYQQCDKALFISKVEAGLFQGLGTLCGYYPYRPVGEIRKGLKAISRRRAENLGRQDLCLLLGSFSHPPVGESMSWFVEQASATGLPAGVKVVVVGKGSSKLASRLTAGVDIEVRDWVEQDELESLLVRSRCVLIPQRMGFGSITRLSEIPEAGIPVLASRFSTWATEVHPLVKVIEDRWSAWYDALSRLEELENRNSHWESEDVRPSEAQLAVTELLSLPT